MKRLRLVLMWLVFPWGIWYYVKKAREYHLITRAQIGFEYGRAQLGYERVRKRLLWRAIFWWLSWERFHKKEAAWAATHAALEAAAAADQAAPAEVLPAGEKTE